MIIRPAEYKDVPQIVDLGRQLLDLHVSYDPDYYALENNFEELFTSWVKEQIGMPSQFLLVATEKSPEDTSMQMSPGEHISGFISGFLKALFSWFKTKTVGHISYLIVEKSARQKGIGKQLEESAVLWFRSRKVSFIELYVEEKNDTGQKAWNEYGYLPFKKFLRKKI